MESMDMASSSAVGPQVIFMMDADGRCTLSVGPGLEGLGLEQNELVGADLYAIYTEATAKDSFRRVLAGEQFTVEDVVQERALWTFWQPMFAPDGSVRGAVGVTTDMTEHRRVQAEAETGRRRVAELADLSNALALHVDDLESMLLVAVRAATELTAEYGSIWLRGEDELPEPRAVWHPDAEARAVLWTATKEVRGLHGWNDMAAVEALTGPRLFRWSQDDLEGGDLPLGDASIEGLSRITAQLGAQVVLRLPMRSRGRVVGFIDLARGADREEFGEDELPFIREIVDRCTLALDNALLWREERDASEELIKFQALADASQELIQIISAEHSVVYANPRLHLMLGGAQREDLWSTVTAVAGAEKMKVLRRAVESETRWSGELTLSSDTEVSVVQADVFPLYHPQTASLLGTAWMARDITGLRDSESTLRATNAELVRFRSLVEASPDFIAIANLDGSVSYVNPAGRALIGLAPEVDVTQTVIADYLTPEGIENSLHIEQPAVIAHGHWEGQSTLRHRSGRQIHVAIASFLMHDSVTGEPFALATVQRDITERLAASAAMARLGKQRESLLERLVDSEARERSRIAADVHDDSVQAMAAVDLRLGLMGRQILERAPDLLEPLGALQRDVAGATERLRILLFDLEDPDLHHGLAEALHRAAEFIFAGSATKIRVAAADEPNAPNALRAVAYRIAREAIMNSFKHARADRLDVSVGSVDGGLQVEVTDDGVGISEAPTASPPGHHGLSSMFDRAELLGGTCRIAPNDPRGTVVTIWLPGPQSGASPAASGH